MPPLKPTREMRQNSSGQWTVYETKKPRDIAKLSLPRLRHSLKAAYERKNRLADDLATVQGECAALLYEIAARENGDHANVQKQVKAEPNSAVKVIT